MSCTIIMNKEIPSFSLDIQILKQRPERLAIKPCGTYLRYDSYRYTTTHVHLTNIISIHIQMHNILNRVRFWFLGQSTRGWFWVCRSNGMDTSLWKDDANICIYYDISHSIMRSSCEQRIIIIHDCPGNDQITKIERPWNFSTYIDR